MDKKIEELTQAQKNLMIEVRNEWVKKIERPNDLTVEKVKPHIEWLYEFSGLNKPKIIVADSPYACQIAVNLIVNNINQVRDQIGFQVCDQIRDQIMYHAMGQFMGPVRNQVMYPVMDQVINHIRDHVINHVRDYLHNIKYINTCNYGDILDYGWCSYYDYFTRIGAFENDDFNKYLEYLNSGIFYSIQLKDVNIVCGNPEYIDRDPATGKLHSEDRKAIQWKDGWGLYFLRGVYFEEDLWKKVTSRTCELKTILSIQNTEQRMAALSLEHNRLLLLNKMDEIDRQSMIQTNADLKSVEVEYILYKLPQSVGIFDKDNYFVFTTCPSTGRQYLEGVDPKVGEKGDVFECVASQFQITKEEFLSIGQHS